MRPRSVMQCERKSIELQLADIADGLGRGQSVAYSLVPGAQLVLVVGVVEREHRPGVRCLGEALTRLASDTLRGRVRRHELRMIGLELLQPVHDHVVLRVRYFRRIENVVQMLVVTKFVAEGLDLLVGREGMRHREDYKEGTRLLSREAAASAQPIADALVSRTQDRSRSDA